MTAVTRVDGASRRKASGIASLMTFAFAIAAVAIIAVCMGIMSADDSSADPTVVTLEIEGGEGTDGAGTVEVDANKITVSTTPTRTGYAIEGYYTDEGCNSKFADKNGNIIKDVDGWTLSGRWVKTESPTTIYVKWKIGEYTIQFWDDGVFIDSIVVEYGSDITARVAQMTPNRDGFNFTGWNPAVPDIMTAGDITTYAQWSPITYTIAFDGNGADSGSMDSISMTYGEMKRLHENEFVKHGYSFNGWLNENKTDIRYNDEAWALNDTTEQGHIYTLYANWAPITYSFFFYRNDDGGIGFVSQDINYGDHTNLRSNEFVRVGYVFNGWNTEPDGSGETYSDGQEVYNVFDESGHAINLWAQWTPITYNIAFNGNDADSGSMSTLTNVSYGTEQALPDFGFAKTGYKFSGEWAVGSPSGDPVTSPVSNLTTEQGQTVTLYTLWTPITYHIAFAANGALGVMDPIDVKYDTDQTIEPTFIHNGYDFNGWAIGSANGQLAPSPVRNLTATDGATVTLFALWTPKQYTITLDAGEGGVNGTATVTFGSNDFTVTKEPTKNGCDVMLYCAPEGTVANDNGNLYNCTGWVSSLKWCNSSENQTLTVSWIGKTYTVQLRSNGGDSADTTKQVTFGAATNDTGIPRVSYPTRTGYYFAGYFTVPDGNDNQTMIFDNNGRVQAYKPGWTEGGQWSNNSDEQVLYAHWTPLPIDVDVYYGDENTGQMRIYYDSTQCSSMPPSIGTGYKAEGLYADSGCTIRVLYGNGSTVHGVADWTDTDGKWKVTGSEAVLYIKYKLSTTELTLDKNGGDTDGSAVATYSSGTLTDYVPATWTGYSLTGYYTVQQFGGDMVIDAEGGLCDSGFVVDGKWHTTLDARTFYARWMPNKYTLTYDLGDGTDVTSTQYNYGVSIPTPDDPEREGYTFAGWSREIPATMPAENVTITALWTANVYKITVDPNGGTGTFEFNVTYGTSNDVPYMTDAFSKVGHHIGSYLSVDISGYNELIDHYTEVATGQDHYRFNGNIEGYTVIEDSMVKWVHAGDVTVSLSWSPNVYNGILSSDGYGTDGSFSVTYGFNTVNVTHASADGYDRAGYYTEPKGAGTFAISGGYETTFHFAENIPGLTDADGKWIYTGTETVTLYSKWEPQLFPVTVDKNGGDQDGWYQATYMDDHFLVITQVTRQGATLIGIYADAACSADKQIADKDGKFLNVTVAGFLKDGHWVCLIDDVKTYAKWAVNPTPTNSGSVDFVDSSTDTVMFDMSAAAVAEAINDASKTAVNVSGDGWKMEIPKDVLAGAAGMVSVSAQKMDDTAKAALPASVKERIAGKTVYSLDLSDANGKITFTGKKITVSLPYTLAAGESADNIKVFCISGENLEEFDATYDAEKKMAVFETEHFSDWFVDVVPDDSSSGSGGLGIGVIIGIIAAGIVVAAVAAVFVMKKKA